MTMPTGFVKSTIHASGAARRAVSSARSRTTGTVRSAFAKPPAPVVSCPMPPYFGGIVSSTNRAAWPPTRSWTITKSAPSRASSRSTVRRAGRTIPPVDHPVGEAADDLERVRVDVEEGELVDRQPVRRASKPSMSSGV